MAGTNDFLPFSSTDTGTNLETQAAYAIDPNRAIGNQPGVASSKFVNKALRQANYITSCLAQFIANVSGSNMIDPVGNIDNTTIAAVLAAMQATFKKPPSVTKYLAGAGVYTPPANVAYLRVRLVGGGAGGGGVGTSGSNGVASTFGTALLSGGGAVGISGGIASLGVGPIGLALGGADGVFQSTIAAGSQVSGGAGGSSPFGGAGGGSSFAGGGGNAKANTGSGGGGSASPAGGGATGYSGGSGGYVDAIITPAMACWAATFNYAVGAKGTGGAGSAATSGGDGADGQIIVEEFYQ